MSDDTSTKWSERHGGLAIGLTMLALLALLFLIN